MIFAAYHNLDTTHFFTVLRLSISSQPLFDDGERLFKNHPWNCCRGFDSSWTRRIIFLFICLGKWKRLLFIFLEFCTGTNLCFICVAPNMGCHNFCYRDASFGSRCAGILGKNEGKRHFQLFLIAACRNWLLLSS